MNFLLSSYEKHGLQKPLNTFFKIPNYNAIHQVRENRSAGDVSLFIHEANECKDFSLKLNGAEVESVFRALWCLWWKEYYRWWYISPSRFCCQIF